MLCAVQWTLPEEWNRLKTGLGCVMCADIHLDVNDFSFKVAEFEHTYVRLPKNQYPRGWTIVFLKRHVSELFELNEAELLAFWRDVARAGLALQRIYTPAKINYGVFGNLCPHLHCHLVIQTYADDPTKPLNMNERELFLTDHEYADAIRALKDALAS